MWLSRFARQQSWGAAPTTHHHHHHHIILKTRMLVATTMGIFQQLLVRRIKAHRYFTKEASRKTSYSSKPPRNDVVDAEFFLDTPTICRLSRGGVWTINFLKASKWTGLASKLWSLHFTTGRSSKSNDSEGRAIL